MDTTGNQIAYQVAWKAAVELIANGIVEVKTEDIGAEVKEVADALYAPLAKALLDMDPLDEKKGASPSRSAPSRRPRGGGEAARQSGTASRSDDRWTLTEEPCPNEGCDGVLLHNTTDKGPEWQCSKVARKKRGTKWVDVGDCDYTDWGANGNF